MQKYDVFLFNFFFFFRNNLFMYTGIQRIRNYIFLYYFSSVYQTCIHIRCIFYRITIYVEKRYKFVFYRNPV